MVKFRPRRESPERRPGFGGKPVWFVLLLVGLCLACSRAEATFDPVTTDPPAGQEPGPLLWEGSFKSAGQSMNAIVYEAGGPGPHPTALLLHGFPGNERNLDLAQALRRAGWNVVFFHYRGAWGSEGTFSFSGALSDVLEVTQAVTQEEWARSHRVDPQRIAVVGHSMGGFLALAAASRSPEIQCAVSMAGPNLPGLIPPEASPEHLQQIGARFQEWAQGRLAGASGPALISDLTRNAQELDLIRRADGLKSTPVLLLAARSDRVVPAEMVKQLHEAYKKAGNEEIELITLEGDHSFSGQRIQLARHVLAFLDGQCR
ncbi:MAG: alpha/beta fold hydrolase [Myxococcota bacterium]|nr:alpha/beta fold hydrolase [Myxococcota bacterium]